MLEALSSLHAEGLVTDEAFELKKHRVSDQEATRTRIGLSYWRGCNGGCERRREDRPRARAAQL
jgi:hypothetical protein